MKTYLECIPCFFRQAIEASRLAGAGKKTQKRILDEVALQIPEFPLRSCPPEMARIIHGIIKRITEKDDPYSRVKKKSNKLALDVYPQLLGKVNRSKDRLLTAIELAIAGNIIDYGVKNSLNVKHELDKILKQENEAISRERKSLFDYCGFKNVLKDAKTVLYLADNAGEVVFDRILIEEIKKQYADTNILFAVKEKPILNDALAEDARVAGISDYAQIISSGVDAPGTVLSLCSKEFLKIFRSADMVISKGQGNFESLSDVRRGVFLLFMAKCPVVAEDVKCRVGDIILLYKGKSLRKRLKTG